MIRQMLLGIALSLTLTGCAATSALSTVASAVSPNKPDITAQVGKENTKQGLGVNAKVDNTTNVGDVSGGSVNASKQAQQVKAGSVQAESVKVTNGSTGGMLAAFGIGAAMVLAILFWFVPTPKQLLKGKTNDE